MKIFYKNILFHTHSITSLVCAIILLGYYLSSTSIDEWNKSQSSAMRICRNNLKISDSIRGDLKQFYSRNNATYNQIISDMDIRSVSIQDTIKPDHCLSGHEADVWYLGKNGIKWINDTPTVITGFADDVYEVQSSICDRSGDLLLYSDGNYIYNKFHERIANIRNYSGSSSSMFLILPQPGNDSIYYVFHPQETTGSVNDSLFDLFFTVIDIRANLGHCKVLNLGQLLLKTSSEKVTGVRHCNGRDWWIIGLRAPDEAFHSWILSDTSINVSNPIISYSGNINHLAFYDQENLGWLKPSHDGKFLIEVTSGSQLYSTLEIHKFNSTSGIITDGLQVLGQVDKFEELYSIEWSPNQQIIYVTGFNKSGGYDLFQMNVSKYDQNFIRSSLINLASTPSNIGSPILGKDQKIYLTNYGTNLGNLHIIKKPNRLGMDCELELFNFDVMNELDLGAPLFASGLQFPYRVYIQGEHLVCQDTMVRYILTDPCSHPETQWSVFDGAKIMRQAEDTIDVYFGKSGNYRISATYPTECGFKTDTIEIEVEKCKCNNEISWSTIDTLVCQGSDASFKFSTTSKEVYLDNQKINTDSFTLPNLQSDTCINLRLVYPRFCDSIIQICIRVLPVAVDSVIFNLCPTDSVFIYDTWYSKDTSFTLHYISKLICDSLVTYKIDAHSFDTSLVILDYCIGDTAIINNQKFWFTDTLHQLFQSTSGCLDSFQQLIISFNSNIKRTSQSYQRCFGDSIFILDHWYSGDTVLIDTLMSSSMCDSISTITIDILPAIAPIIINYSRCQGDTLLLTTSQGFLSITYSRMFKDTWTSFQGCDSVVLHQVSFYPNSSSSLLLSKCKGDSIFYKDKYYINPLKLVDSFSTVYGCDSLVSIEIVDYPVSSSSLEEMSSCLGDSILFQSNWFKKDTTIELLLTDQNGCDSIHQVSLSFRSLPDTTNLSLKVCKGDSIFYDGTYYYDSARIIRVFPSSNNCDSIVYVSIDLLSAPISSIDTFSICPGDSIYIDNRYYYDSVILSKKFQAVNGCDSLHTIIISLNASPEPVSKLIDFCKGDSVLVKSHWYKNPEDLQFRIPSALNCDSLVLIKLKWYPTVDINLTTELDLVIGSTVVLDAGITQSGLIYRWYPSTELSCNDCSNPILTATKDSIYYLEIIDQNGCLTLDSIIIRIIKSTNNDIYLPPIFSPNDDNINDIWIPIVGSSDIDIYQISIYDRWGAMVFSTTTLAGWNGKIGSQPAIPGVYAYFISWQDGQGVRHNTRGDITLVR